MEQGKIINAIKALDRLKSQQIALPLSYRIYKLRQELQPHWDWQVEQEMKIMQEIGEETENGLTVKAERGADFNAALRSIVQTDVEQDWNPVKIDLDSGLNVSMEDLEALEGFIEIGDGES